jgi:hypothetical protein
MLCANAIRWERALSLLLEFFGEIVLTYLVKGLGYVILRCVFLFRQKNINPDGWSVVIAGTLGWGAIIVLIMIAANRVR